MNRPIKFRAWDRKRKVMRSAIGIDPRGGDVVAFLLPDEGSGTVYKGDCELMQFTGLCDKNGKEIYEGDILSVPNYDHQPDNGSNPRILTSVVYANGGFRTSEVAFSEVLDEDECEENCEVIGNVFENPELL